MQLIPAAAIHQVSPRSAVLHLEKFLSKKSAQKKNNHKKVMQKSYAAPTKTCPFVTGVR
jgi:hypothetical protein